MDKTKKKNNLTFEYSLIRNIFETYFSVFSFIHKNETFFVHNFENSICAVTLILLLKGPLQVQRQLIEKNFSGCIINKKLPRKHIRF